MRKVIVVCLLAASARLAAQRSQPWSLGAELGVSANSSLYTGGDEVANGRFHQGDAGNASFHFLATYELCDRLSLLGGIGIQGYAFEYSLHEDYSLIHPAQGTTRSEFTAVEFPILIQYRTPLNCRNRRWRFSAGIAGSFIGAQRIEMARPYGPEASAAILTSKTEVHNSAVTSLRWKISKEKVFQSGNFVQVSFNVNVGLKEIARSTAFYKMDGKDYEHSFINKGSYVGLSVGYFFSVKEKTRLSTAEVVR
jgi:hypothetical protein